MKNNKNRLFLKQYSHMLYCILFLALISPNHVYADIDNPIIKSAKKVVKLGLEKDDHLFIDDSPIHQYWENGGVAYISSSEKIELERYINDFNNKNNDLELFVFTGRYFINYNYGYLADETVLSRKLTEKLTGQQERKSETLQLVTAGEIAENLYAELMQKSKRKVVLLYLVDYVDVQGITNGAIQMSYKAYYGFLSSSIDQFLQENINLIRDAKQNEVISLSNTNTKDEPGRVKAIRYGLLNLSRIYEEALDRYNDPRSMIAWVWKKDQENALGKLSVAERMKILTSINKVGISAQNNIITLYSEGANGKDAVLKILTSTPQEQTSDFAKALYDDSKLVAGLIDKFSSLLGGTDNSNDLFMANMLRIWQRAYETGIEPAVQNIRIFHYTGKNSYYDRFGQDFGVKHTIQNNIEKGLFDIQERLKDPTNTQIQTPSFFSINPSEPIIVLAETALPLASDNSRRAYVPAFYYYWLRQKAFDKAKAETLSDVVMLTGSYMGAMQGMALINSSSTILKTIGYTDLVLDLALSTDYILDLENRFPKGSAEAVFIQDLKNVIYIYAFARVGSNLLGAEQKLAQLEIQWAKNRNSFLDKTTANEQQIAKIDEILAFKNTGKVDDLLNTFKTGYTKEQILAIPKGSRPPVEVYLKPEYIKNHISKFEKEGGAFIMVKNWTQEGRFSTMPPRKFIGLRSEMDAVIQKYKKSGNDWKVLRDELNLGADTKLASEEIYYIRIDSKDSRFSYEIPNGNEGGAIPGEWMPGGTTINGTREAVLIGSEKIIHNKDINQLLHFFGKSNWEKIK